MSDASVGVMLNIGVIMDSDFNNVEIDLEGRNYSIIIGDNLLDKPEIFNGRDFGRHAIIVTNTTVGKFYLERLRNSLRGKFDEIFDLILPDGESFKNWENLNLIFDALLEKACDRKTTIFALGGGVVGDMAGFAASVYMRGISFVQVPTTLLAQVDSSVGGKTAINHPRGKNMIGTFYQPKLVVCDFSTLSTLPSREFSAGLAEVIKYGVIFDRDFWNWLNSHLSSLIGREPVSLSYAIRRCCEIKASVVRQDEREEGLRAILNFGHTFGHAIEAGMGYGVWLHGEGVSAGMVMAAELSWRLGLVDADFVQLLIALIRRAGLPTKGPVLDANDNAGRYLELMRIDKKSEGGEIRFVLIDGLGKAMVRAAPDSLVRDVIDACCEQV
ncbi:MAG: 3-dehydroquinate synthase [Oscillatoria princeps RMCB-10]|nr:3-dehydroquinate synthase [Oscillatoria princeps RMCB-10]